MKSKHKYKEPRYSHEYDPFSNRPEVQLIGGLFRLIVWPFAWAAKKVLGKK